MKKVLLLISLVFIFVGCGDDNASKEPVKKVQEVVKPQKVEQQTKVEPKKEVVVKGVNKSACAGCHGANFEKHALGKSKIVKDLTHAEIATALKGYKAGTFGGSMKGVMKGQISKYSDTELEKFAQTIGK